jgi:hypothetical protein
MKETDGYAVMEVVWRRAGDSPLDAAPFDGRSGCGSDRACATLHPEKGLSLISVVRFHFESEESWRLPGVPD